MAKKTLFKFNKSLIMPQYITHNFADFNFKFNNVKKFNDNKIKTELLKKYSLENLVILFNGEIIYNTVKKTDYNLTNDAKNIVIQKHKNRISENIALSSNISNLNSVLFLNSINSAKEINVIISGNIDINHYSYYLLDKNCYNKINVKFELFNNAKINYFSNVEIKENSELLLTYKNIIKNCNVFGLEAGIYNNAKLLLNNINLAGADNIIYINIDLLETSASAKLNNVTVIKNDCKNGNNITINHLNKQTSGIINFVGIIGDNSSLNVEALSIIEKGYRQSNACQNIKAITLTDNANVITNPQLIINEYDVSAKHKTTVGQIDTEQLYYLMSRGIAKNKAVELLIMANINEIASNVIDIKTKNEILKFLKSVI